MNILTTVPRCHVETMVSVHHRQTDFCVSALLDTWGEPAWMMLTNVQRIPTCVKMVGNASTDMEVMSK